MHKHFKLPASSLHSDIRYVIQTNREGRGETQKKSVSGEEGVGVMKMKYKRETRGPFTHFSPHSSLLYEVIFKERNCSPPASRAEQFR